MNDEWLSPVKYSNTKWISWEAGRDCKCGCKRLSGSSPAIGCLSCKLQRNSWSSFRSKIISRP